jgi:hypothetical protein
MYIYVYIYMRYMRSCDLTTRLEYALHASNLV